MGVESSRNKVIGNRILAREWDKHERLIAMYKMVAGECSAEQLNWQPESDTWSIIQVLEHLHHSESATLRFISAFDFARSDYKLGMGAFFRAWLTRLSLSLPLRYRKPVSLPGPSPSGAIKSGILFSEWDEVLAAFSRYLESFPKDKINRFVFKHPLAGRFNLPQALGFLNAHLKHHFYQIDRIKRNTGFPKNDP